MTVLERRLELLRDQVRLLLQLLDDPQPGLATWHEMMVRRRKEIDAIYDGERDH